MPALYRAVDMEGFLNCDDLSMGDISCRRNAREDVPLTGDNHVFHIFGCLIVDLDDDVVHHLNDRCLWEVRKAVARLVAVDY